MDTAEILCNAAERNLHRFTADLVTVIASVVDPDLEDPNLFSRIRILVFRNDPLL
jgi:hypothetical protein